MASPFEILGLLPTATSLQVTQTWRRLAGVHHPDRGGDPAEFHRLRRAYQEALAIVQAEVARQLVCTACQGTGRQTVRTGWTSTTLTCPTCGGSGQLQPLA